MKKYIINQMTQLIFWVGVFVTISAIFLPRDYIFILGIVLLFLRDDSIKAWLAKQAPTLAAKLEEWTK